jgi:signal transduction histidine kinase/ActR/RegA family two-component response regulator
MTDRQIGNIIEILIVEDSITQAEELRYILESNDYKVTHAVDTETAIEILEKKIPDIIISDIVMPGMDGFELCSRVKSDIRLNKIPLILLTSLSEASDIIKGLESGTDSFITKPYNEEFLLSKIQYLHLNFKMRKDQSSEIGLEVLFAGKKHLISSDRLQILDLLLSTYENSVIQNIELEKANKELSRTQLEFKRINLNLERIVEERTLELRKNQHLLVTLTAEAPIVMFSINKDGVFTISEGKGLKKLDLIPGQVVSLSVFDVYKDYPDILIGVKKALAGEEVRSIEKINGIYYDTLYRPVSNELDEITSVVGVAIDVTNQKLSEEKLKIKTNELEKANIEKEGLIVAKDKLFSIIAHDLLANFNPLLGFSDLLLNNKDNLSKEEIYSMSLILNDSLNNQFQLLTNLLEWGRIQNGRLHFNPKNLNLFSCINETAEILKQNILVKEIGFEIEVENGFEIFADKYMLDTIFRNLISNAIKFSNTGEKIRVSAHQNNGFVQVNVTDFGLGINKINMKKMFDKNEFLSTPGTKNERGSGLGLILCREFIEKHGGKIWAESMVGSGTTISFTLINKI